MEEIDFSGYNLPKGNLTGENDNPVLETQYNNLDVKDYETFLHDWQMYYAAINDFKRASYYQKELKKFKEQKGK